MPISVSPAVPARPVMVIVASMVPGVALSNCNSLLSDVAAMMVAGAMRCSRSSMGSAIRVGVEGGEFAIRFPQMARGDFRGYQVFRLSGYHVWKSPLRGRALT